MPKMVYTVADFDNPQVREAANPSTTGGWHYGPIPNANADWTPPEGTITPEINGQAPNPGERFSGINGRVCDVAVNGDQMCGRCFSSMIAYRRHLRQSHPGASANPNTANSSDAELAPARMLSSVGFWNKVGEGLGTSMSLGCRGPLNGLINEYADACEQIARTNTSFRATFGDRFHRDPVTLPLSSGRRKRNRGPTPPGTPEPEP
ncbi:hypothetical protein BBP40_004000 [Aspergillus hancockii]|nr:hypothetical protein BBP40_004000 [Aspergillus hancockii]